MQEHALFSMGWGRGGGDSSENVPILSERTSISMKNSKNCFKQTLQSIKRQKFPFLNFFFKWSLRGGGGGETKEKTQKKLMLLNF